MITVKEKNAEKIVLEFTNGDIEKLYASMAKYGFKDYEACLRYAMSVINLTNGKSIGLKNDDGSVRFVEPATDLVK
ncbi:MAG: hypothetical protein IKF41_00510 [Alphaproteobacteria bacterium]|nr:hypothetical protein [Alphaproteobacteria bacterium]